MAIISTSALRKITFIVLAVAVVSFGAAEIHKRVLPSTQPLSTTGLPAAKSGGSTPMSILSPPPELQKSLDEIKVDGQDGSSLIYGTITAVEPSTLALVADSLRFEIFSQFPPLFRARNADFSFEELVPCEISDFEVGNHAVLVYNSLGYLDRIVLIKP